jgi:hypothetical protein
MHSLCESIVSDKGFISSVPEKRGLERIWTNLIKITSRVKTKCP